MEENIIIQQKTKYGATFIREIQKSFKKLPGENIEIASRIIIRSGKIMQPPGIIIVTNKRIVFFKHHGARADTLLYIPLSKIVKAGITISSIASSESAVITLEYDDEPTVFALSMYQAEIVAGPDYPYSEGTQMFFELLKEKLPNASIDYDMPPLPEKVTIDQIPSIPIELKPGGPEPISHIFRNQLKKRPLNILTCLVVSIIFFSILFSSAYLMFFAQKTDYQIDSGDRILMEFPIFGLSLACGFILLFTFKKKTTYCVFIIAFISLIIAGYLQYQIYADYFGEPNHLKGLLTSVDYYQSSDGDHLRYGIEFQMDTDSKVWKTGNHYSGNRLVYYLDHFKQYLGQNISIVYSSHWEWVASVKDDMGNYIYRRSDPCMKFLDPNNYCLG